MALIVSCINISVPGAPPQLNIPHFGLLQKGWDALGKIPDPSELLAAFQDQLAIALAPVRRFLEIVEVFLSLQQCVTAIPDAITSLSPGPIFDCIEQLAKTIARVLSWLPPLSYVRLALDIMAYCIDLVDEILAFFTLLDSKITDYINTMANAQLVGDIELIAIVNCGLSGIRPTIVTALDMLKFIQPICDVLMDMFLRLIPSDQMREGVKKYKEAGDYMTTARDELASDGGQTALTPYPGKEAVAKVQNVLVPVPPLSPLLEGMNTARNAVVLLHNILAPIIGDDTRKEGRSLPEYDNF